MADTATLTPSANGSLSENWSNGAGSAPSNVDTNDGDTSYRTIAGGNTGRDTFAMDNLPSSAAKIEGALTSAMVVKRTGAGAGTTRTYIYDGATGSNGASRTITASYVEYTDDFATAPGSAAWTPAGVNAIECGVNKSGSGASATRNTQVYATVDWSPAGGGYVFLLAEIIGPVIGANILARDIPGICALLAWTKKPGTARVRIDPKNYFKMLRELKEAPRRSFFLPGLAAA